MREFLPRDVESLGRGIDELDAFGLDARMREVSHIMQEIDWQTGRILRTFRNYCLHLALGFRSFERYVHERLSISSRKARALVRLDRKAMVSPELEESYRKGEVSWVKAMAILPVIARAEGWNAVPWVERAKSITCRRLLDEVDWAIAEAPADEWIENLLPPPPGIRLERTYWQMRAPSVGGLIDSEIVFTGPASVIALLKDTAMAFSGYAGDLRTGFERLLLHVRGEWANQPRHRDPIFARDGWRCMLPCCTARRDLHDHHRQYRSRQGTNEQTNRLATCFRHHQYGIHAGHIFVEGKAPDGLTWRLGVRTGKPPLLVLKGETYLEENGRPVARRLTREDNGNGQS